MAAALLCCLASGTYAIGVAVFAIFGAWAAASLMALGFAAGPALYFVTRERGVGVPVMLAYAVATAMLMAGLGLFR